MTFPNNIKGLLLQLIIIITVIIGSVLFFFYWHLPNTTNHGETIVVPDLYERNIDELTELLEERGLSYEVSDSVYDSKYPPLTILHQYPEAQSRVKEGRKIFLSVNRKAVPMIPLPDFTDKSITHYKAILKNTDLYIEKITSVKNPYEIVLDVIYNGESVEKDTKIPKGASLEIVMGDGYGRNWFPLQNMFGFNLDDALFYIKGSNLNLEPLRIPSGLDTTDQELFIIRQEPHPHDTVNIGEFIKLWVDTEIDSTFYFELLNDSSSNSINYDSLAQDDL